MISLVPRLLPSIIKTTLHFFFFCEPRYKANKLTELGILNLTNQIVDYQSAAHAHGVAQLLDSARVCSPNRTADMAEAPTQKK